MKIESVPHPSLASLGGLGRENLLHAPNAHSGFGAPRSQDSSLRVGCESAPIRNEAARG